MPSLLLLLLLAMPAQAERLVTLASTTSTENSGLLDWLLPKFRAETGYRVRVIAVGTGQALRLARNGDADVLLTHAPEREAGFVAEGWGLRRVPVMQNDFVLVGPGSDPAQVRAATDVGSAFQSIAEAGAPFASRGDESGTHIKEQSIWRLAGMAPDATSRWYRELGSGMGATLNAAAAMNAYTLTDRATWLAFNNRRTLEVVFQGDPGLANPYAVIVVNPARHGHVNAEGARALATWLTGDAGKVAIAAFRLGGQQAFYPAND